MHAPAHTQVDPLVSLMMVEKVPDSTYDMIGGLDKQIKEIKEVRSSLHGSHAHHMTGHVICTMQVIELPVKHPELFESLGIAQPKVSALPMSLPVNFTRDQLSLSMVAMAKHFIQRWPD